MSAVFKQWVDAARAITCEQAIAGRSGVSLKRQAGELVGPCPVCGGTDRFSINPVKDVFFCRVSGATGNAIALIEYLDGCDFKTAVETLTGTPPPVGVRGAGVDPELAKERETARAKADKKRKDDAAYYRRRARTSAHDKWNAAGDPIGTPVHDYWQLRGLTLPPPRRVIRYQEHMPYWWHPSIGRAEEIHCGPAMLAAIQGPGGNFIGVHVTWLDLDVPNGKAEIVAPDGDLQPAKKVYGSQKGGAIRLYEGPATLLVVGEGIETTASAHLALVTAANGNPNAIAAWCGINLGNIAGKADGREAHPTEKLVDSRGRKRAKLIPSAMPNMADDSCLLLPDWVTRAVYLMDGDSDFYTTRNAMTRAAIRNRNSSRCIGIADPGAGVDFNDLLLGKEPEAT